jgi:hypothetical protein
MRVCERVKVRVCENEGVWRKVRVCERVKMRVCEIEGV